MVGVWLVLVLGTGALRRRQIRTAKTDHQRKKSERIPFVPCVLYSEVERARKAIDRQRARTVPEGLGGLGA